MNTITPTTKGFEKIICEMLRGSHVHTMNKIELIDYISCVGIAIHNIPHNLHNNKPLSPSQIDGIKKLDPTGGSWLLIIQN